MKFLIMSIMLLSGVDLGWYFMGDPTAKKVYSLQDGADIVIWHFVERSFRIEISDDEQSKDRSFDSFADLEPFLKAHSKKELAVFWFHKSSKPVEELQIQASALIKNVQEAGFKRVVVLGAHGSGVFLHGDSTLAEKHNTTE